MLNRKLCLRLGSLLAIGGLLEGTTSGAATQSYVANGGHPECFANSLQTRSPASGALSGEASLVVVRVHGGQRLTIERGEITTTSKGCTLTGYVRETGESAILMRWNDGRLTGMLGYKGHIYTVMNVGDEAHAVREVGPRTRQASSRADSGDGRVATQPENKIKQWPPQPASALPAVKPFLDAERLALEAKNVTIDVMFLYTKKAAAHYMLDLADLVRIAVKQTNQSFRNSGLENIRLRLAHIEEIDYNESDGEHFEHLYRLVDGVGPFKVAQKLRNEKNVDVVGLIVDDPSSCGLATRVAPDPEEAFFVVHHSCAAITLSIAHEIGHILGARHDRQADSANAPFPYGHGYVNGDKWRDIMGYPESCGGCPRIPYWSNPRISYRGEPTGTVANDNARVILGQAERVSKFR